MVPEAAGHAVEPHRVLARQAVAPDDQAQPDRGDQRIQALESVFAQARGQPVPPCGGTRWRWCARPETAPQTQDQPQHRTPFRVGGVLAACRHPVAHCSAKPLPRTNAGNPRRTASVAALTARSRGSARPCRGAARARGPGSRRPAWPAAAPTARPSLSCGSPRRQLVEQAAKGPDLDRLQRPAQRGPVAWQPGGTAEVAQTARPRCRGSRGCCGRTGRRAPRHAGAGGRPRRRWCAAAEGPAARRCASLRGRRRACSCPGSVAPASSTCPAGIRGISRPCVPSGWPPSSATGVHSAGC